MKKLFVIISAVLLISACGDMYKDELAALQNQIDAIKSDVDGLNSDLVAIRIIVEEISKGGYLQSYESYYESGIDVGYIMYFSDGRSIVVRNGKDGHDGEDGRNGEDGRDGRDGKDGKDGRDGRDGKDGSTPLISVKQDSDGQWYWTLNGEWLLDAYGNKVRASGTDGKDGQDGLNGKDGDDGKDGINGKDGQDGKDGQNGKDGKDGKDGITPQLKIENGYWFVSVDGGLTWTMIGKATGDNGKDGKDGKDGQDGKDGKDGKDGDSFFENVEIKGNEIIFTLSGGTVFSVPRGDTLSIEFDAEDLVEIEANQELDIHYNVTSVTENVTVEVLSSSDIRARIIPITNKSGVISVKTGNDVNEYSKVIVLVNNGARNIMKAFYFEAKKRLFLKDETVFQVSSNGEDITVAFLTNVNYTVNIPTSAQSWITNITTKALIEDHIDLRISKNTGGERAAEIEICSTENQSKAQFVVQQSAGAIIVNQSANCYIVSPGKSISFPLVKGNSNTVVGTAAGSKVVWETRNTTAPISIGDVIESTSIDNGNMVVSTKNVEGNALVAAVDANNVILWSWHIWVTDFDPEETKELYVYKSTYMMCRNLGALSHEPSDMRSFGLYYQWGRKDPFLSMAAYTNPGTRSSSTSPVICTVKSATTGTVDYATKHPNEFIYINSFNIRADWLNVSDNGLWRDTKTIYDPCPSGWKVPDRNIWSSLGDTPSIDEVNHGVIFGYGKSEPYAWYPFSGYMYGGSTSSYPGGSIRTQGVGGNYWSSTAVSSSAQDSYQLYISLTGGVNYSWDHTTGSIPVVPGNALFDGRSTGLQVRCCKE